MKIKYNGKTYHTPKKPTSEFWLVTRLLASTRVNNEMGLELGMRYALSVLGPALSTAMAKNEASPELIEKFIKRVLKSWNVLKTDDT